MNEQIRRTMKQRGVKQWRLAEFLGVHETTLCRRMRREITGEEKAAVLNAIDALALKAGAAK